MSANTRLTTGIAGLDDLLGGGLLPGTLTVVVGSTGIGKTQFGLQFARAGLQQEGASGIIFDMTARGDSQNHADYAQQMFGWDPAAADPDAHVKLADFFAAGRPQEECLHIFNARGQRVTRNDMDFDAWRDWQAELRATAEHHDRLLLRQLRSRCPPGGDRRHRAGRSAQRFGADRPF